ncbi:conserved hypothetical protein [Talaromyces stipitatus ATCC 10500]|uniref:F-box domain-containing protein n=1 Tax=Talaromyces stipitatus (strain ATCC 10500 / CBS 375.48 / QM 6759 / NRRL 1006) TaxID=441959 RepID=B8LV05_TALSN|nr:uncharacterized protein TSTA_061170 [Talaromyces stipitatus ATCC 10500]EED22626.1 conserved hypothetical protein [Talaromyces stipitatus ATCC 10500]
MATWTRTICGSFELASEQLLAYIDMPASPVENAVNNFQWIAIHAIMDSHGSYLDRTASNTVLAVGGVLGSSDCGRPSSSMAADVNVFLADPASIDPSSREEGSSIEAQEVPIPLLTPIQRACLDFCIELLNQRVVHREYSCTLEFEIEEDCGPRRIIPPFYPKSSSRHGSWCLVISRNERVDRVDRLLDKSVSNILRAITVSAMVHIQDLPVELLGQILEFVTEREDETPDENGDELNIEDINDDTDKLKDLRNICLVSRSFRDLAQPLLFRDFDEDGTSGDMTKIVSFAKSIYRNPELAKHVQRISIEAVAPPNVLDTMRLDREDFVFFKGVVKQLQLAEQEKVWISALKKADLSIFIALLVNQTPNLRHLCLPGGEFSMEPILRLFQRNPSLLSNLELFWIDSQDECAGHSIAAYARILTLTKLRTAGFEYGDLDRTSFPASWTPGVLAVEDLAFHHCHIDAYALQKLTKACKKLKSFAYNNFSLDPRVQRTMISEDVREFNAAQAHKAMLQHKDTLEHFNLAFASDLWDVEDLEEHIEKQIKIGSFRDFAVLESVFISHELLPPHPQFPHSLQILQITDCNVSVRGMVQNIANDCKNGLYPNLTNFLILAVDITRPIKLPGQRIPPGQTPQQCYLSLRELFDGTLVDFLICPYKTPDFNVELQDSDPEEYDEFIGRQGPGPSQLAGLLNMIMQHALDDPQSAPGRSYAASDDSWETESDD